MMMRRTTPSEPSEPFEPLEPAPPHSFPNQGTSRPGANPEPKIFSKNLLTQRRQYGKIIPVADEAAPFERAMKKISKNHLTNLYECGKIIKSLEERWFFEN